MGIILRSDNRLLTENTKYSYLVDNLSSGSNSITVINTDGFETDGFMLIEDVGKEVVELFRIGTVNTTTGVITLLNAAGTNTNTVFAHAESTKVYAISYDQIRFFWTAAAGDITDESPTFDMNNALTSWAEVEPAAWYTTYEDEGHSTGFGWFVYRNSVTEISSQPSNAIPYAGFAGNTAAQVFEDFDSLLNSNELRLVTIVERFAWLNEALTILKNKLNLNNVEYFVSTEQSISIVSGTAEYILPSDFSDLIYVHDGTTSKIPIPYIGVDKAGLYGGLSYGGVIHNIFTDTVVCHYIRNRYIGFTPTPTAATTYKYRYRAKATTVSNLATYIDLPDNAFYSLKDFMMYRACLKFNNPMAQTYYQSFINSVNLFIQASVKRDANLDTWEIAPWANV